MGLFDKLFRRGDNTPDAPLPVSEKFINRALTPALQMQLENSTLKFLVNQVFMHYYTEGLVLRDPNDQAWQNQAIFFWEAAEPFPKKSLPPQFESIPERYFTFAEENTHFDVLRTKVMPWFGMPGNGHKYSCEFNGKPFFLPIIEEKGIINYREIVELTTDNTQILTDRDNYFFLVDANVVQFKDFNCFHQGRQIPLHAAYSLGGLHIIKGKA